MIESVPLPEPELFYWKPSFIKGESVQIKGYTAEAMHAHAAAVSAAKDAEIAQLRADNTRLQNEVVMPLRERVRVLEDALQRYVNHDLLTGTRGKMNEIARAALEKP